MDKITIVLQDKQTIEQLAADPDIRIRIKDSVIDGVARRYLKISNIAAAVAEEIRKELFKGAYGTYIKDEYRDIICKQVKKEFNKIVEEELIRYGNETKKAILAWKEDALQLIKERDIEKDIREVAEKVINEKLQRIYR